MGWEEERPWERSLRVPAVTGSPEYNRSRQATAGNTSAGAFRYAKLTGRRNLRKMERNFLIESGQPIEMAVVILNFVTEFLNKGKEPVNQKWNGEFRSEYSGRKMWTTSRGDPEYSG